MLPPATPQSNTRPFRVRRIAGGSSSSFTDVVAVEEPFEIRISYSFKSTRRTESVAVTMRTPGEERELAAGFLLSEGVIDKSADILEIRTLGSTGCNEVLVELSPGVDVESWRLRRSTLLSSACGLCGKSTLDSIPVSSAKIGNSPRVSREFIYRLPALLSGHQANFSKTGGLHAAALVRPGGELEAVFEDIGRHNALDKLIGYSLLAGSLPLSDRVVFMSSRGSFELVQKSLAAGCPILATIGAPSSLAIEFARDRGQTLIGFVRDSHFNLYSGEWRIDS
jgi:FdhD protein